MVFRNAHTDQHRLDFIKRIAVVSGARLRLKQYNGPNILPTSRFCGNSFLLNASSQLDGILNDTLPGGAVIYHYGELYHVLLLQLTGVHIGDNVAVFSRRCRQIEYEGRIQIIQHLRAELRFCIVAFVHNNDWLQMAQHLDQCRIRCIGQQRLRILEILCKAEQIAVFLIDLANIFLPAVNAQRAIAHHTDRQHFPHCIR